MGYPTGIEWTDATWNPIGGCSVKSPGCIFCYAQDLAGTRLLNHALYAGTTDMVKGRPIFNGKMTVAADDHPVWQWPLKWRGAKHPRMGAGMPSLIFVGDMSDLFHENRPLRDIDLVFAVMALCPQHTFQVLTKRPDRMREYLNEVMADQGLGLSRFGITALWTGLHGPDGSCPAWPLPNVWLGTSVERQQEADERIPLLLQTPAAVHFLSSEPLLGPIDLSAWTKENTAHEMQAERGRRSVGKISWCIVGGESGPDRRPTDIAWMHSLRDQCQAAGVAYFHKQMTGKKQIPDDLMIRQFPAGKSSAPTANAQVPCDLFGSAET